MAPFRCIILAALVWRSTLAVAIEEKTNGGEGFSLPFNSCGYSQLVKGSVCGSIPATKEGSWLSGNYFTDKTQGSREGVSTCKDLTEETIDMQGSTGDFVVVSNECLFGTGWKKIIVFNQKRCPGPEKRARSAAYDVFAGYDKPLRMFEEGNEGRHWCVSPGFKVQSFMYSA